MKNNKIALSLQKIELDDVSNERILEKIRDSREGKVRPVKKTIRWLVPVAACLAITLTVVATTNLIPDIYTLVSWDREVAIPDDFVSQPEPGDSFVPQPEPGDSWVIVEPGDNDTFPRLVPPPWHEMSLTEQFWHFTLNGVRYDINATVHIEQDLIGESLGTVTLTGFDIHEGEYHQTTAEVFVVNTISRDAAVAVRYEGFNLNIPFVNKGFAPATLGDLIDAVNLHENLWFTEIRHITEDEPNGMTIYRQKVLPYPDIIWDMLLGNRGATIQSWNAPVQGLAVMSIVVNVDVIGDSQRTITVTAEGYVQTDIAGGSHAFYIGASEAQAFIDYVLENMPQPQIPTPTPEPCTER